jgi:hypothetical protein
MKGWLLLKEISEIIGMKKQSADERAKKRRVVSMFQIWQRWQAVGI